jgi:1-deoxy-D-xylulose-5-phosphate reductoisomerase
MFMAEVAKAGTELLPVDSEHSAAFQAIGASDCDGVEQITLTASGGPFWTWSAADMARATPEAAIKHPRWSMGPKISVDSATLMNKGLELIEAFHLFSVGVDRLAVVVHPQSIVHCLVSFKDGSVLAQLSNPDMRTPIALSLSWPRRMEAPTPRLDLVKLGALTFEAPDEIRFPALRLAKEALRRGGSAPIVLNAANEAAVAAFLGGSLPFPGIAHIVESCLERALAAAPAAVASVDDVFEVDRQTRRLAREMASAYV